MASVPARPGRATCCTPRHGRLRGTRGASLQHFLHRSLSRAPERRLGPSLATLGRLGTPHPFLGVQAPDVQVSAAPRMRSYAQGRGCPTCPRAQQCRTPRPTAAHVAHCLCLCVVQTRRRGRRRCCSGRLALAQCCGGVRSAVPTLNMGSSSSPVTWYYGPLRAPCGMTGPVHILGRLLGSPFPRAFFPLNRAVVG